MYDAWQNVFASLGSRTTGNESGAFALVGPGWNGTLPANVTKIQAPTNTVLIVGRAQQNGPTDLPTAAAFQDDVTVTPVSAWGTHYTPPATVPGNPNVNLTYVRGPATFAEVANMTPDVFYGRMATVMGGNPPSSADKPVADQMARIGIIPGTPFNWNGLNATMQNAIAEGFQDGISQVAASINAGIVHNNSWDTSYVAGAYGTNYTLRDAVVLRGSFPNLALDSLYFTSNATASGVPYPARTTTCYTLRTTAPRPSTRFGRSQCTTPKATLCPIHLTDRRLRHTSVTLRTTRTDRSTSTSNMRHPALTKSLIGFPLHQAHLRFGCVRTGHRSPC